MAKIKVLLADDVQLFLELEKSFFSREEVYVRMVRSGREVLEAVAEEMPDLIFLDMFMPEMNGDERRFFKLSVSKSLLCGWLVRAN